MKAEIYNQSCWVYGISDMDIENIFRNLLVQADFFVIDSIKHDFVPHGSTILWLIGESHLAVHSFPEINVLYIELSSCVESKAESFWEFFRKWSAECALKIDMSQKNVYKAY